MGKLGGLAFGILPDDFYQMRVNGVDWDTSVVQEADRISPRHFCRA
jgi:hypothetical protein